jgi:protocatechuate 3,4-dioxygenase beta subunit
MSRVIPAILALLLTAVSSSGAAQFPAPAQLPPGAIPITPPRDTSAAATGTAIIRGHVYDAANGAPLRKVQVRVTSPELRESRLAVTDNNGAYEIKNLAAGRYQLNASKGSFVGLQYGQTRPFEPGKPLEVQNGQTVERVDFRLPHGAVITGRVLDEAGETASDVQVTVMRYSYQQGRRQLTPLRGAQTNDIGEFRLFAIPPGQYYVSATLRNFAGLNDAAADDRSGYAPTYYPNVTNVNDAQRITLGVGQTLNDINIALSPTRMSRITGVAVTSDGKPVSNGIIMLAQTSGAMMVSSIGGQIKPDGSFTLGGVTPGDYVVRVMVANMGPGAISAPETVEAKITVAGEDINDLRLTGVKPSTLSGRIILPGLDTDISKLRELMVLAIPKVVTPGLGGTTNARAKEDGTFELMSQPGLMTLRLNPTGSFAGIRIKTVRVNGADVTDTGFEVRPNENLSGFEVELTSQLASVTGTVSDARGNAVRDYTVLLFPRDKERWESTSRYLFTARPDQDGKYKASYVLAGAYYAIALDYVEQGANSDPDFLERIKDKAVELNISDTETKSLDLKLVTGM